MRNMSSRGIIALSTVAIALLTAIAVAGLLAWKLSAMADRAQQRELAGYARALAARAEADARRSEAMAALVASIPQVQADFEAGDRSGLEAYFVPGFETMRGDYGVRQFQFHLPPATSFLRVHRPERYGDDLSGFRQTVVDANAETRPVRGLERGVAGVGVRGVVPVVREGRHLGTVEFGLSFDEAFVAAFKADFGVEAAIYLREDGAFVPLAETIALGDRLPLELMQQAFDGSSVFAHAEFDRQALGINAFPLADFSGNTIGVAVVAMDVGDFAAMKNDAYLVAGIAAAIATLIAALVAVLVARAIGSPILRLTETMRRLAEGDVSVTPPYTERRNEIGAMAQAVLVFRDNECERRRLEVEQARLRDEAEAERCQTRQALARDFESHVGGLIEQVAAAATEMQSTAGSMSAIAEKSSSQATTVASAAEQASANVQTVAAAGDELGSSIDEIARQVQSQTAMAGEAADAAKSSDRQVQNLAEQAQAIGEVVDLITSIAEQTNLLALNATIEAARAGDAGKGFAVVASEVKSLANQTAKATEQIAGQIKAIQEQTGSTVAAIDLINEKIQSMSEISAAVASAVEEQNTATREIGRNVQEAAAGTQQVSDSIVGVNEAAQEAGTAANQVLAATGQLSEQAEQLSHRVKEFIEQVRAA